MKAACILLTVLIFVAIMAVCVMVKFATDITVEDRRRDLLPEGAGGVYHLTQAMGVIALSDNTSSAAAERFPYMAAVIRNSSKTWTFACFASVILVKWVVTSAHCRQHGSTHRILLYHDFIRNYSHTYPILFWRLHERFNVSNPTPKFDIAVAKINVDHYPFAMKPAVFDDNEATSVEASIWKTVLTMEKKMYLTNDFEKYDVEIANKSKCFEAYGMEIDDSLICIDLSDHEVCFVHEFGPIFDADRVVGVLAVKPRDCDVKLAVFTNVSFYSNWILKSTHTTYYG